MRWTRKSIIEEIRRMKNAGGALNYSSVEREHLNLTRAAAWHFGNWRGAVEAAGIDYDDIRKYRRWNRERVIARIRELHKSGADLSWRAVSTQVDPALAAAALRVGDFANWRDAITAAGLDIEDVARYRFWDEARVLVALRDAKKRGDSLSSKAAQQRDQPLFCAARRRFGTWNNALQNAGITPQRKRREDRANAAAARVATPSKSAAKDAASNKSAEPQVASTRGAKTASAKNARPSVTTSTTKSALSKSAPAKPATVRTGATEKEAAPNAASTRATKSSSEAKATAAKSAPKSGATKTASAAKAPAAKTAAKATGAKTSAAKPAAAKSAKATASRAANK